MYEKKQISRWELLKSQLNNLDPEDFKTYLEDYPDAMLIDCRKPSEVASGKLPGATNVDYLAPDFWEQMDHLDARKAYFVYCRSGRRSTRTCTLMQNGGFCKVYNLDGGLNAWLNTFGPNSLITEDSYLD